MKRAPIAELLDSDSGTADEVAGSLADLFLINRAFGGISTASRLIERIVQTCSCQHISLLEVASGPGEVQKVVQRRLQRSAIDLEVTFLDRARSHLNGSSRAVVGDAVALPFSAGSFDLVSSTLFMHHLTPDGVRQFVSEALRVCRIAVLINDIVRHPLHLALVYAGLPLFRSRLTWHDAPASVRQAYTLAEMRSLLTNTSATRIDTGRHFFFRMGIIAWKH